MCVRVFMREGVRVCVRVCVWKGGGGGVRYLESTLHIKEVDVKFSSLLIYCNHD